MRVEPDFLAPLLAGFTDDKVFAVSCQIFLADPDRVREETGLTQGWWESGALRVRHRIDPAVSDLYPCFYGGGGSCAFDRKKFLELGGFDSAPGPVLPRRHRPRLHGLEARTAGRCSINRRALSHHEHRGTIGKRFTEGSDLSRAEEKLHSLSRVGKEHSSVVKARPAPVLFLRRGFPGDAWPSETSRAAPISRGTLARLSQPSSGSPVALASPFARREIDDTEALRRPLGGYFRDRFESTTICPTACASCSSLPYPILPACPRRRRVHVPDSP